jgi:outer membrane protein|tara:strand:- start:85 stop:594 length:510 start_codon:yes stop_codon:yes gene_type:complete
MLNLNKLFFLICVTLISFSNVSSQTKLAHIDTQKLILSMPEMNIVQAELEALMKNYANQYMLMEKAVESKNSQYLNEFETQTKEINKARNEEIRALLMSINEFKKGIQFELGKKERELTEPIKNKVNQAIIKVATAQGFNYVLDSTQGQGVILADGKDLMADVKIELGF